MCGIAGFADPGAGWPSVESSGILNRMNTRLAHRGPDSQAKWWSPQLRCGLAHQRLAILDLSDRANQPMFSINNRYVLAFNGEIYNHKSLRRRIQGINWRTESDTETLVEAFSTFGIDRTLALLKGMFAIALVDRQEKKLFLIRDRIGEKPLFFTKQFVRGKQILVFASQVHAMHGHPGVVSEINPQSVQSFALYGYLPANESILKDVEKVPPGYYREFDLNSLHSTETCYWSINNSLCSAVASSSILDKALIDERVETMIDKSVESQMISDVPLGAFLSGGIDSSLVVSSLVRASNTQINTFSVGFSDSKYDESNQASAVAKHFGTRHHQIKLHDSEVLELVKQLPSVWDEPFADSSQIAMLGVSRYAKQYVTVALSGDGGDELFAGYERYRLINKLWQFKQFLPNTMLSSLHKRGVFRGLVKLINSTPLPQGIKNKINLIERGIPYFSCNNEVELYEKFMTSARCHKLLESPFRVSQRSNFHSSNDYIAYMRNADLNNYLPNDILVKVDRAAMAFGLETRVPLLDHEIVSFGMSLPSHVVLGHKEGKLPLRRILSKRLPEQLMRHPKKGFGVPLARWLREPLRKWVCEILDSGVIQTAGFFSESETRKLWLDHIAGRRNNQNEIWRIVMFHAWYMQNYSSIRYASAA